jgi:uncharacterized repeat protein (TIGR03803 family)
MSSGRETDNHGRAALLLLGAAALAAALLTPIAEAAAVSYQVLYSFCSQSNCRDGALPLAGLVMDAGGNLYGTTVFSGVDGGFFREGVVFKLAPDGTETVLHAYGVCQAAGDCADGAEPWAGLVMDGAGNLYGTTIFGGAAGQGVVFALEHRPPPFEGYRYRYYHSFCEQSGCTDGALPYAGLVMDGAGNLYGTTATGGAIGLGVVFKQVGGTETVLYSFCAQSGCADGAEPHAGLVIDAAGNLYGTTIFGGNNVEPGTVSGGGVVFKLAPNGTETVLYNFCAQSGCADGVHPDAGLVMDAAGNLYGTTPAGGSKYNGVVFKLAPNGTETVLHIFCSQSGCTDGALPYAGLATDAAGNLYGTTAAGGVSGGGVVFKLAPDGTETVLYNFCSQSSCTDGSEPRAGLILDAAGNLYGTTHTGGNNGGGVVFIVTP